MKEAGGVSQPPPSRVVQGGGCVSSPAWRPLDCPPRKKNFKTGQSDRPTTPARRLRVDVAAHAGELALRLETFLGFGSKSLLQLGDLS